MAKKWESCGQATSNETVTVYHDHWYAHDEKRKVTYDKYSRPKKDGILEYKYVEVSYITLSTGNTYAHNDY